MRIDILRHANIGDTLTIENWPATRAHLVFAIKDSTGEICATASSL